MTSVLHVITTINRGGAENHLVDLVRGQVARGWRVAVAFLRGDGYWTPTYANLGVTVTPVGARGYADAAAVRRLARTVAETAPTILHLHMPPAELMGYAAWRLAGRPGRLLVSKHNAEPFWPAHPRVGRWLGRRIARESAATICISTAVGAMMRRDGLVSGSAPQVIPYGIDTRVFEAVDPVLVAAARRAWGATPSDLIVGCVARHVPQKAIDVLLRAVARPELAHVVLVLVGRGPLQAELQALAEQLGIASRVRFVPFREDMPVVMASFDVLALTSDYEGLGLVLLEAMAAGRPVVATAVDGIPEVVGEEGAGVLVARRDAEGVARALLSYSDPAARERAGAIGRRRAATFSLDVMVDRTLAVYGAS